MNDIIELLWRGDSIAVVKTQFARNMQHEAAEAAFAESKQAPQYYCML